MAVRLVMDDVTLAGTLPPRSLASGWESQALAMLKEEKD
jgi:hypothetical protein